MKKYNIEPLIYKFATALERNFVDKIFAAEFHYIREQYKDVAKHLYDITILFENDDIENLLNNKEELQKLILYKRSEEEIRIGGINKNIKISNFKYMNEEFKSELINSFEVMQNTYVFDDKYKTTMNKVLETIRKLKNIFMELN